MSNNTTTSPSSLKCTWLLFGVMLAACGTIVGNPKKPTDGTSPTPGATKFELPLIGFDVPEDDLPESESGASLLAIGDASGDKTLLKSWTKRFNTQTKQLDRLSGRINTMLETEAVDLSDDVIRFTNRGEDGQLSGKIAAISNDADFQFEAVLCHEGKVVKHLKWSDDQSKISLVRDFNTTTETGDKDLSLITRLTLNKSAEETELKIESEGTTKELTGTDGNSFNEIAYVTKSETGTISVRTVADHYQTQPAAGSFAGDRYLVGRLTPHSTSDSSSYDTAFIAYFKGLTVICRNGFDESRPDVWDPTLQAGEPRWCVGRPEGERRFSTTAEFLATINGLKDVGLVSKSEIKAIKLDDLLSCE